MALPAVEIEEMPQNDDVAQRLTLLYRHE